MSTTRSSPGRKREEGEKKRGGEKRRGEGGCIQNEAASISSVHLGVGRVGSQLVGLAVLVVRVMLGSSVNLYSATKRDRSDHANPANPSAPALTLGNVVDGSALVLLGKLAGAQKVVWGRTSATTTFPSLFFLPRALLCLIKGATLTWLAVDQLALGGVHGLGGESRQKGSVKSQKHVSPRCCWALSTHLGAIGALLRH